MVGVKYTFIIKNTYTCTYKQTKIKNPKYYFTLIFLFFEET